MKPRELVAWRRKQFLDQVDLADLLGVHPTTVANWERGRTRIPQMAELAFETITQQRARLIKQLALRRRELAEQRALKAIAQGVDLQAFKRKQPA
jgi:DNA-binding transcriptional regulator YdaS (Cro superfamily)